MTSNDSAPESRSRWRDALGLWKLWLVGLVSVAMVGAALRYPGVFGKGWSAELFWGVVAVAAFWYGFRSLGPSTNV